MKKFKPAGAIDNYADLCLLEHYFELEKSETVGFSRLEAVLENFPIWNEYLKNVDGVGPAIGSILIAEIDIHRANYPSSLWMLAGLDVAWDGRGRSKRKDHLIDVQYKKSNGEMDTRKSITFKPFLKTKMVSVAAPSFVRLGSKSPYSKMYYDYKNRLINHPRHRNRYIALDVEGCKETLSYIPSRIYDRSYITEQYQRCEQRAQQLKPDLNNDKLAKEAKKLLKDSLGSYEILETLIEKGLVIGSYDTTNELGDIVKAKGGVLRIPKEKEVIVDEDEAEIIGSFIKTIEEFDDTADAKNRTLYKCVNIGKTKDHRNKMAYRYIAKRFLADLYVAWRTLEGLPVAKDYAEAKLGIVHGEVSEGKL